MAERSSVVALARAAASSWGYEAPILLRTGMNTIFVAGDAVLRVGRPIASPADAIALAGLLTARGVHVAVPLRDDAMVDGELTVTAWERLVPVEGEPDWAEVGRMVARVHELRPSDVPTGYPVAPCESFPWWQFDDLLGELADDIDGAARIGLQSAVDRHRGWSDRAERVVCHGDVHPGNVVMTVDGPALLDWDLLCHGPPAWDHAMLVRLPRWGWPARWYDDFAAGYGRTLADDPVTVAIAELRLVAATLMRVKAGRTDPAAMPEVRRRLAFWRGDPDAPIWTAV